MQEFAAAKINLTLHITGRRTDGYHLLDSLVAFTDVGDVVEASPSDQLSLEIAGPFAGGLPTEGNLVLRAAELLRQHEGVRAGASLRLHKHLPVGSGIGGGSADAAAALRLLTRLWQIDLHPTALADLALSLGADVPVCLASKPVQMRGIGEVLMPAPALPPCALLLLHPGKSLLTADVYRQVSLPHSPVIAVPGEFSHIRQLVQYLRVCRNDLEIAAKQLLPDIAAMLEALSAQDGCLLARMSGSGATCFGIFEHEDLRDLAAQTLTSQYPAWWVEAAAIIPPSPSQGRSGEG